MNPPPEHGAPLSWTLYPSRHAGEYHAQASTSLDVADTLYFIAEGNQIGGHFEVSQTGSRGSDVVEVDVEARYRDEGALDTVVVSRLIPEEGKQGIGIFRSAEDYSNLNHSIRFHIHIRIPKLASESTGRVMIDTFTTDLPLFSHHLHHLASSTYFDNVVLKTSQCSIQVDALAGGSVSLYTSNAEIRGTIHATKLLHIDTSNARVALHAGLLSDQPGNPTHMVVQTSNGPVETDITLSSATPEDDVRLDPTGGLFDIIVRTSNAPLTVAFSEQPIHAQLTAALNTQNAPRESSCTRLSKAGSSCTLRRSSHRASQKPVQGIPLGWDAGAA
ncbi:hypothetical protein C8Q80DRAFT_1267807 [Daedaleopsis nitida]|nr:hypothetical protein C8Q80DRAFT_1267807 [Daedaleopsis nitida]